MTTDHVAHEIAQQAETFEPPTYVQEELEKLQQTREHIQNRLIGLRSQETDLTGQIDWNDAVGPGTTRVRLTGPGSKRPTDTQLVRGDTSEAEAEL